MAKLIWNGPGISAARWYGKKRILAIRKLAEQLAEGAHPSVEKVRVQLDYIHGRNATAIVNVSWDGVGDMVEPRAFGSDPKTADEIVRLFGEFVVQHRQHVPQALPKLVPVSDGVLMSEVDASSVRRAP